MSFLSLDGTFWVQLLNFGIFFLIANVVFLRPVGEAVRKRREYIDEVQADFERYQHQVTTLTAEGEERRAAARRAAQETTAAARSKAEAEAAKTIGEATQQASALVERAHATVDGELNEARGREPELAAALARTLLERAVGEAAT
jgi:F0F1-type ATP synthase membrane subunit b/b'